MVTTDLLTLTLSVLVACFIVQAFIIGVITLFEHEQVVIDTLVQILSNKQSELFKLLLNLFYLFIAFFTLTGIFVYLYTNIGLF